MRTNPIGLDWLNRPSRPSLEGWVGAKTLPKWERHVGLAARKGGGRVQGFRAIARKRGTDAEPPNDKEDVHNPLGTLAWIAPMWGMCKITTQFPLCPLPLNHITRVIFLSPVLYPLLTTNLLARLYLSTIKTLLSCFLLLFPYCTTTTSQISLSCVLIELPYC